MSTQNRLKLIKSLKIVFWNSNCVQSLSMQLVGIGGQWWAFTIDFYDFISREARRSSSFFSLWRGGSNCEQMHVLESCSVIVIFLMLFSSSPRLISFSWYLVAESAYLWIWISGLLLFWANICTSVEATKLILRAVRTIFWLQAFILQAETAFSWKGIWNFWTSADFRLFTAHANQILFLHVTWHTIAISTWFVLTKVSMSAFRTCWTLRGKVISDLNLSSDFLGGWLLSGFWSG